MSTIDIDREIDLDLKPAVMPQQVDKVKGAQAGKEMLHVEQHCKKKPS